MEKVFSVVIAHYNSFHLMEACFRSLENQTYKDFEAIIVDDCSTDGSYEKLQERVKSLSFPVRVLQQSVNKGPGAARNLGLDNCQGKYVTFIDADDFVEETLFEDTLPYMEAGYDAVVFDAVQDKGEESSLLSMVEKRAPKQGEIDNRSAFVFVRGCTVGKVYRLELLRAHNVRFGEYYRSEDIPFTKSALALCQKIFYLQKVLYHYVEVSTSIVHNDAGKWDLSNSNRMEEIIYSHVSTEEFAQEIEAWKMRGVYTSHIFTMIHDGVSSKEIKGYIKKYYSKKAMKNPYIREYPRSRYIMMRVLATGFMPLVKKMYRYIHK